MDPFSVSRTVALFMSWALIMAPLCPQVKCWHVDRRSLSHEHSTQLDLG